jgi:DNA-directed RNA polymerase specialized sigma24 family protein
MAQTHKNLDTPEKQQRELLQMHGTGKYSISDLAELLSISRPTVYHTLARAAT